MVCLYSQLIDRPIINDTTINFQFTKSRYSKQQLYFPAISISLGIASNSRDPGSFKYQLANNVQNRFSRYHTQLDNYLQFSPIILAYTLDAFGVKSKNNLINRSIILIKAEVGMALTVEALKHITHYPRPDHSNFRSFPSGHTAQSFLAATFLSEEYKDKDKWMPYAAYGVATSVGLLRMVNNKHFISDVLVGAGIGYLSMKLSYWTHRYRWK